MLGRTPDTPVLGKPWSHPEPRLTLVGEQGLSHPRSTSSLSPFSPLPSAKLSRHYPIPAELVTPWGADDALAGGPHFYLPQHFSKGGPPASHGVIHGER